MLGIFFALLSASMFAVNYVLAQLGMKRSEKDNGVFMSIVVNVVMLGLIFGIKLLFSSEPINWNRTAILSFIFAGLLTTLLGRTSLYAAIRRIGSSRAAALKNSAPIFTIMCAALIFGERLSWLSGLGICIVMAGLSFLAYDQWQMNSKSKGNKINMGLMLAGLSALFFGMGQALRKFGLLHMADPFLGAWIGSVIAFIGFCISLVYRRQFRETFTNQFIKPNKYFFWSGVAAGIAQLSFFMSANYINVSYTSAIAASEPVLTIILAYFFLKQQENIQRSIIFSILFVFLGIVLISLSTLWI